MKKANLQRLHIVWLQPNETEILEIQENSGYAGKGKTKEEVKRSGAAKVLGRERERLIGRA